MPLTAGPPGEGRPLAARGDLPSGMGVTLRSLRCKLWTGASRMSLLSLRTGGRVKVISYLCWIFRKPTCRERGIFIAASPGRQGTPPRLLEGPSICCPGVPSSCYSPAVSPSWFQAFPASVSEAPQASVVSFIGKNIEVRK